MMNAHQIVSPKKNNVICSPVMAIIEFKGYCVCSTRTPLAYTSMEGWDGSPGSNWRVSAVFGIQIAIAVITVTAFPFTGLPSEIRFT